jgi:nucleoside-diphosphate-sugar epimerase
MLIQSPVAAVTGASGYLGSHICHTLESSGWQVIRLSRSSAESHGHAISYDLAGPITPKISEALQSADALIHAAYDLTLTNSADIWRVNVEGTRRLLKGAKEAGTSRVIVLSSMTAFEGTSQLYGRAKLAIEAITVRSGGCAIRPGLVYGKQAGGMAGSVRRLTNLPIVPVIAGGGGVYTVREEDLMEAIVLLASTPTIEPGTISIAHPSKVTLKDLMSAFAAEENRRCRFVPVPWQLVYWLLKSGEQMRLRLPFRADSLLGLIHTAPTLIGEEELDRIGVTLRAFNPASTASSPGGKTRIR